MTFDKKEYRRRRELGLRGQPPVKPTGNVVESDRRITKKALLNNTKRSRKLAVSLEAEGGITI